jgi:hypothetical protein
VLTDAQSRDCTSAQRNECEKSDDQSVAIVESVYLGDVSCSLELVTARSISSMPSA